MTHVSSSGTYQELVTALDRDHFHREYGYFGMYGKAGWLLRRIGRPGCRSCELIGRPLHLDHDGQALGPMSGRCLAWADEDD